MDMVCKFKALKTKEKGRRKRKRREKKESLSLHCVSRPHHSLSVSSLSRSFSVRMIKQCKQRVLTMGSFAFRCNRNTEDMFISSVLVLFFGFPPHPFSTVYFPLTQVLSKNTGREVNGQRKQRDRGRERARFCLHNKATYHINIINNRMHTQRNTFLVCSYRMFSFIPSFVHSFLHTPMVLI